MQKYTVDDFKRQFPDDGACLDWLRSHLYPDGIFCKNCNEVTKHHRMAKRRSYSCDRCGNHVHPTAGTIFHKSTTPLHLGFHAVYLMASTRCGISAKQIQREVGVTYKTAWRMFKQIRSLLQEDVANLAGDVELDESFFGGKNKNKHANKKRGQSKGPYGSNKTPVFGALEGTGHVFARVVPDTKLPILLPHVEERVLPSSTIYTDEAPMYEPLENMGYQHKRVHHAEKVYVAGDAHVNSIEGFWSLVKRGIGGVYHSVSTKYLQTYLDEYAFRYNHREDAAPMFTTMLRRVE